MNVLQMFSILRYISIVAYSRNGTGSPGSLFPTGSPDHQCDPTSDPVLAFFSVHTVRQLQKAPATLQTSMELLIS